MSLTSGAQGRFKTNHSSRLDDIKETDFTLDYKPGHGRWDGLWFRVRYARLREDGTGEVANQLRVILKCNFQIL
jgi:hypothetical protein